MCDKRQFTNKELYVISIILNEVSEKWSNNPVYQDIKKVINEKLNVFECQELSFKREYECTWLKSEGLEK